MEMLVITVIVLGAFALVLVPLFRRRPGTGDEREFENIPPAKTAAERPAAEDEVPVNGEPRSEQEIQGELQRYREAVRAGTVCRKCGQANPPGSRFCYECGARLPAADAKEFE